MPSLFYFFFFFFFSLPKSWALGDNKINRKAHFISHCQGVRAGPVQVIILGALLSLSTLWVCNFGRGRGQRLIKSFCASCGAQYRSSNHQGSLYTCPFSLPKLANQNSSATIKIMQILAIKHNGANSQLLTKCINDTAKYPHQPPLHISHP